MVRPAELDAFFSATLRLKSVKRAGWVSKVNIKSAESVADHTFSTCAVAMVFADVLGLQTERIMKMVILHDLAESIVGDFMPGDVPVSEKINQEKNAMDEILSSLPAKVRTEYQQIWREFLENTTDTARFVHKVDKLEMAMQASQYVAEGYDRKMLDPFFDSARRTLGADGPIGETFAHFASKRH